MAHAGFAGLKVLLLLASDPVCLPVLDKGCARLHKAERDIPGDAFLPQFPYPVKIAWPVPTVVFSTAGDLFDLPAVQIPADVQGPQKRRTVQAFMFEGQFQKKRNPLVCTALVFAGHIKENIIPSILPIGGKAFPNPLRPFGQQQKDDIASDAHNIPGFGSSVVRFLQEKFDVMHTLIISPLCILYFPVLFLDNGYRMSVFVL